MADIFISVVEEDRSRASEIARELETRRGWSVSCEPIRPDRKPSRARLEELTAARCVVALWSSSSSASPVVRQDVLAASGRNRLVMAVLDPASLPGVLAGQPAVYLGPVASAGLNNLIKTIEDVLARSAVDAAPPQREDPTRQFATDVYISFALLDNAEPVEGGQRWVTAFKRALEDRLTRRLGRTAIVHFDSKLQASDVFDNSKEQRLRDTAVFISIVSPTYVRSEWALGELNTFRKEANRSEIPVDHRVLKVLKTPVPVEQQPEGLQSLGAYEFFSADPETREVRELDPGSAPRGASRFFEEIDRLADDIAGRTPLMSLAKTELGAGRDASGAPSPPQPPGVHAEEPAAAEPVLLGVAAPRHARRGSTFPARFVAYLEHLEDRVGQQLRDLDASAADESVRAVLGLTPDTGGRWTIGTPVTVRAFGQHVGVEPSSRSFEWNGRHNLVAFLVSVDTDAPAGTMPLTFEVFIEGVSIAMIPISVTIGDGTKAAEAAVAVAVSPSTAFASYSSKDAAQVTLCLSALKRWDPGLDVFVDCLDLTPNQQWQRELERVIPTKETFLLFWSVNASQSPWVAWELREAESTKGLDWIRPMPIDDPAVAPPPAELKHLQFDDRYLIARQAFLRRAEQLAKGPST
jgi:hypothetical protein